MTDNAGEFVASVIQKARKIFSDKSVNYECPSDNHNRQTHDSAARFKQDDDSDDSHNDINRSVSTSPHDNLMKIDDVIAPAARPHEGKNNVVERKGVFRHGLCGRKEQKCKELHECQMRGTHKLSRDSAA